MDLVTAELEPLGEFDLVVCLGLLYHLREPWRFVDRVSKLSDQLWIWTQVCAEAVAAVSESGFNGRVYAGGPAEHSLSVVRTESFFPTLGSLCDMLRSTGFSDLHLMSFETTLNGPGVSVHATRWEFRSR